MTTRLLSSAHALRAFALKFAATFVLALLPWRGVPAASLTPEPFVPRSSRFT